MKSCKKPKPWGITKLTYQEWGNMKHDWVNETKLDYVESYFFRYDNYIKGQKNDFILKSVFGRMDEIDIKKSINKWFNFCVGAYSEIEISQFYFCQLICIRIVAVNKNKD